MTVASSELSGNTYTRRKEPMLSLPWLEFATVRSPNTGCLPRNAKKRAPLFAEVRKPLWGAHTTFCVALHCYSEQSRALAPWCQGTACNNKGGYCNERGEREW